METVFQDIRYAVRQLIRTPSFAIAALLVLALGIGANATIFSAVDAVLLNSLPFQFVKDPQQVVCLYSSNATLLTFVNGRLAVTFRNFEAWKAQAHSFSAMEAYQDEHFNVTSVNGHEPEQVAGVTVTQGFLPMLGVSPRIGRNFSHSESDSHAQVAIISDDLWRSRFNADPHILGKQIHASNAQYQIIGVLPDKFELPASGQGLDQSKPKVWVLLNLHPTETELNGLALTVMARLKPQVSLGQASAEMKLIAQRLAKQRPENQGWGVNVFPAISEDVNPDTRTSLLVMQVAVVFVLLIACANVANLLLTKAVAREKEMAVRAAIGASRWRIMRQNLTESVLLSVVGGALGLILSIGGMRLITYLAPDAAHGLHELSLNFKVLAFTLGLTFSSGILFGLAPSFHAFRQSVAEALSRGSRSVAGSSRRFRAGLVVVEMALSLILLVGAGLTIRSILSLMDVDTGFRPDHLLTMDIALPSYEYRNPDQFASFDRQLLTRVQALPGVKAASLATALPMRSISEQTYTLPGEVQDMNHSKVTDWTQVTAQHLDALGLHLLKGRNLTQQDVDAAKPGVALVNQAFAQSNWPKQDALGKVFVFNEANIRVIGIVSNSHQFGPDAESHTEIFLPAHDMQKMLLLVRTVGDPLAMANPVKRQIWTLNKDLPVSEVDSMENILSQWVAPRRFTMTILLAFAVIALISAAIGLYSVLAYAVTLRTREIGVRVALGAEPGRVAGMVLREGIGLSLIGIVVGLAGAFALTRFMQSVIFGVSAFDAATFISVSVLLAVIAAVASYVPARRASLVNPLEALRGQQ